MLQLDPSRRQTAVRRFFAALELERSGPERFTAQPGPGGRRMFGGLIAAQSLAAARATLDRDPTKLRDGEANRVHSVHCHFLLPGRHGEPLDIRVRRVRDGRAFSVRHTVAQQANRTIFEMTASFTRSLPGLEHADAAPAVPPPEQCGDREEKRLAEHGPQWMEETINAVEVRLTDPSLLEPRSGTAPYQANWFRFPTNQATDDVQREAMLLFASDRGLLSTAVLPHGLPWGRPPGASLDHTVWFHRATDLRQWHLFSSRSPVARDGLALIQTAIYDHRGQRVATACQEALLRAGRS